MNRETKRLLQRQGQLGADGTPIAPTREARTREAASRVTAAERAQRESWPKRVGEYLREVRQELSKVAWPGRQEVVKYTLVVLFTIILLTSIVFGLDALFAKLVMILFGR